MDLKILRQTDKIYENYYGNLGIYNKNDFKRIVEGFKYITMEFSFINDFPEIYEPRFTASEILELSNNDRDRKVDNFIIPQHVDIQFVFISSNTYPLNLFTSEEMELFKKRKPDVYLEEEYWDLITK